MERIYNIPLRKGYMKAPRHKRAKKAVTVLKQFLARHMKAPLENIKIGAALNDKIWTRGIKNPPHHVKVTVSKEDDMVTADLFGIKKDTEKKKSAKKETKKSKEKDKKEDKTEKKKEDKKSKDSKPKNKEKDEKKKKSSKSSSS